jgi:hypothetical protein
MSEAEAEAEDGEGGFYISPEAAGALIYSYHLGE